MSDPVSTEDCARAILDVTPLIMQSIRSEMRSNRTPDLSVPQFRTLVYVRGHAEASLTDVAEYLGLTLPSTSKMVDGLVKRDLVVRSDVPQDRRRMHIQLTAAGNALLDQAVQCTLERFGETLAALSAAEREQIFAAMLVLSRLFSPVERAAAI